MATRTIWKFPIGIGTQDLPPLCNPDVLFVDEDPAGQPSVWVQHDLDGKPNTVVTLLTVGTGQVFDSSDGGYVGSYLMGSFVWHIYAKGTKV